MFLEKEDEDEGGGGGAFLNDDDAAGGAVRVEGVRVALVLEVMLDPLLALLARAACTIFAAERVICRR